MSVVFINLFEVPAGRDEEFLAGWQAINEHMRSRPGYQEHQLHRSLTADGRYRYANVARWASAEAWRAAHDERFRALVAQPLWRDFPSTNALYEVVHSGHAEAPALS